MEQLKQALSTTKGFAKDNWKYGAVFALGGTVGLIISYSFAKSLTEYNTMQFITKMVMKNKETAANSIEFYDAIPNLSTRPSNELIAWDQLSRSNPKPNDCKDPQKYVKDLRQNMKLFVDALQIYP